MPSLPLASSATNHLAESLQAPFTRVPIPLNSTPELVTSTFFTTLHQVNASTFILHLTPSTTFITPSLPTPPSRNPYRSPSVTVRSTGDFQTMVFRVDTQTQTLSPTTLVFAAVPVMLHQLNTYSNTNQPTSVCLLELHSRLIANIL
ncbi:hypothetical protein BC835DRAFT_277872 [Cytidiella melzeri]|nr:hypothetical protein BC835DRAFT_277872 [Cytidiella melzeri]